MDVVNQLLEYNIVGDFEKEIENIEEETTPPVEDTGSVILAFEVGDVPPYKSPKTYNLISKGRVPNPTLE